MRIVKLAVSVMLLLVFLAGCGGGGGGDNSQTIQGYANINSRAENPRVGIITSENGSWETLCSSGMLKAVNGWQDIAFRVELPESTTRICGIVIFNDYDNDRKYDYYDDEELGIYNGYLQYNNTTKKWELWRFGSYSDYRVSEDVASCSGKDIYIDCTYLYMTVETDSTEASNGNKNPVLQKLQK